MRRCESSPVTSPLNNGKKHVQGELQLRDWHEVIQVMSLASNLAEVSVYEHWLAGKLKYSKSTASNWTRFYNVFEVYFSPVSLKNNWAYMMTKAQRHLRFWGGTSS